MKYFMHLLLIVGSLGVLGCGLDDDGIAEMSAGVGQGIVETDVDFFSGSFEGCGGCDTGCGGFGP